MSRIYYQHKSILTDLRMITEVWHLSTVKDTVYTHTGQVVDHAWHRKFYPAYIARSRDGRFTNSSYYHYNTNITNKVEQWARDNRVYLDDMTLEDKVLMEISFYGSLDIGNWDRYYSSRNIIEWNDWKKEIQ